MGEGEQDRRAVLQGLVIELKELAVELTAAASHVAGVQSYLRLMMPHQLFAGGSVLDAGLHQDGIGSDSAATMQRAGFGELAVLEQALSRLSGNNRRFAMVADLMLAAVHLLEPSTEVLAESFMRLHIKQCRQVLLDAKQALQLLPKNATGRGMGQRGSLA